MARLRQTMKVFDTIVVPAEKDGFDKVFIGEKCWYSVRIAAGKIPKLKLTAVYQSAPVSAITHIAEVQSVELYGETGKYKLNFREPAVEIKLVRYDGINGNQIQNIRYTSKAKLLNARTISDLLPSGYLRSKYESLAFSLLISHPRKIAFLSVSLEFTPPLFI